MKINHNVTYLKTGAAAPAAALNKSSVATGASVVQRSAIANTARIPSTTGDFDAARVAEIRESIRAGSYKVDTAKIADGLISSVRNLTGKNP